MPWKIPPELYKGLYTGDHMLVEKLGSVIEYPGAGP
jgi:hypothetical protein